MTDADPVHMRCFFDRDDDDHHHSDHHVRHHVHHHHRDFNKESESPISASLINVTKDVTS